MNPTRAWMALICTLVIVLTGPVVSAQEDYKIVSLEVEGNRVATRSLIVSVSSLDVGTLLSPTTISDAINRLYGLGIFSDVSIEAEPAVGGLAVFIVVDELPKLDGLEFKGNNKIKSKDLRDDLGLGVGGYISPYLIHLKAEQILQKYAGKGYFRAEVDHSLKYNEDSTTVVVTYQIDEKSKVTVTEVILTGSVRVPAEDIIKKMRNRKRGFLKSSDFDQEKYPEDLTKIIAEYHKKGHVDAYLVSDSFHIDTSLNQMVIYLEVYEGPLYYFGTTEFTGAEEFPAGLLNAIMKYEPGEIFSLEEYQKSIEEVHTAYYEIGHLHTRIIDKQERVDDSIINVTFEISEGLPSHIRYVHIVGNTKTKENVIRRELSTLPGDKYNQSLLIRSVRNAMSLNYFNQVVPTPLALPSGDIDLEYQIEEKQTGQISAGAGYNSQDKLVGNVGMGIPNFRGMGQSLSFNVDFGSRRNSTQLSFTEPWLFGHPTLLGADAFSTNRRWYEDYTEGSRGGSIRFGRRLNWPDNYFRMYTSVRLEQNRFYDFSQGFANANSYTSYNRYTYPSADTTITETVAVPGAYYPGSILQYNEEWNTSAKLSVSITRDSRNLPEFATKGSRISYTFTNTGGIMGGFWQSQKHSISIAKFIPLFWKFALAAKLDYSLLTSPKGDDRILVSDRFTPGGTAYDGIVRGYDDGALTPDTSVITTVDTRYYTGHQDDTSTVYDSTISITNDYPQRVRGKYMLTTNIELQLPIIERQAYLLFFFDAGNSWLHQRNIKPFKGLYRGVGIGFRIAVPMMGTLGFDFAKPLDVREEGDERSWRTHFQIGTTFR